MKVYQPNEIRNLALIGNASSGKTTLAESMLFEGGVVTRRGDINSKNTVSDYNLIEQERLSSVYSTVLYSEINNHKINFIDTPGSDDFIGSVVTSLGVADLGLMVINSQNGVEVGTESIWRQAEKLNKPIIFASTQLDHDKSNFDKVIESCKSSFGNKAVVMQYPLNEGEKFDTIIDILKKKAYKYPADGGKPEITDLPESETDKVEDYYAQLVEVVAEADEELMEKFFENDTLSEDEIRKGLKIGLAQRGLFPIFCVSGSKNMGIGRLVEFICNAFPAPTEFESLKSKDESIVKVDPAGKALLYVFKTFNEQHLGEIAFFKVLGGKITEGIDLINVNTGNKERLSQLYAVAGKNRTKVASLEAGDIGATVKLKDTKTYHTLGLKDERTEIVPTALPPAKHRTAIRAIEESDDEKLGESLNRIHQEDPSITIEYSKELKQIIVSGQGEYHLNIMKWMLDNIYKIETEFITPKIPYRETITKVAQAQYRHKKQSGGAGQFGEVHMFIENHDDEKPDRSEFKMEGKEMKISIRGKDEFPLNWGGKLVFYNCIVGGSIDARFLPAIQKGIMEKMENGPLTGSYARDIRVYVYDGKMHPVDSNEISFKLAGAKAFSDAFKKAGPKLLEPVYEIEVFVPSDRMGDVMSDLQGRRSIIQGMSSEGKFEVIKAKVPLAELNKYSTSLSSLTNGRATYTMQFSEYALCPPDVQEKLQAAYDAEQEEE